MKDPQFGLDVGFFVFTLPFLRLVLGVLTAAVVLSAIAAFVVHYLYGGLRLQGGDQRTTTAARVHLSVLVGHLPAAARRRLLAGPLRPDHGRATRWPATSPA